MVLLTTTRWRYIGETGWQLETRIEEHKKEVKELSKAAYTRTKRKTSTAEFNKSAITDHGVSQNQVIDWSGVRVIDKEEDIMKRRLREAIWIKCKKDTINREKGAVYLKCGTSLPQPHLAVVRRIVFDDGC